MGAAVAVPNMGLSVPPGGAAGGDSWGTIGAFLSEPETAAGGPQTVDGQYRVIDEPTPTPVKKQLPGPVQRQWSNLEVGLNRTNRRAQSIKTPGGIAAMLFAVGFFLMAIVPVNGSKTRLILLWDTLTMRATLPAPAGQQSALTSTQVANASAIAQAAAAGANIAAQSAFPGIGSGAVSGTTDPVQITSVPGVPYVPYSPIGIGG